MNLSDRKPRPVPHSEKLHPEKFMLAARANTDSAHKRATFA